MSNAGSHCSGCGAAYSPPPSGWPRTCAGCGLTSYRNPLPVAVLVVPVGDGLLTIRRGIEPRLGSLALPGGFIDHGEPWREAAARELREETGLGADPAAIRELRVLSTPDGTLLVFGLAPPLEPAALAGFQPSAETSEAVVIDGPTPLAFPLHEQVVREYFAGLRPAVPSQAKLESKPDER